MPNVLCINCVVHRLHLVGKHLNLYSSLSIIIRAVNKIKSNVTDDRMFLQLYQDNNEQIIRLLSHTEVRWFLKGKQHAVFLEEIMWLWSLSTIKNSKGPCPSFGGRYQEKL